MKILLASVTNRTKDVLGPHLGSIEALEVPEGVDLSLAYVSDGLGLPEIRLLERAGARVLGAAPKPAEAIYEAREETHVWNVPTFHWLAREKQRLLDLAVEENYDYVFFVDSDLVLGPETLGSLLACEKPITSAVFWTAWQAGDPELPQVWLTHPYEFGGRSGRLHHAPHEFLKRIDHNELVEVGGLGACTLIRTDVLDRVRYFPILEGLPEGGMWEGEDRSFCIRATQHHIPLFADAWPDIFHIYRPSDLGRMKHEIGAWPERVKNVQKGDLISAILEPLEEPELVEWKLHLRGRLGAISMLPEVEQALEGLAVGEERLVKVKFPGWWELETYRGGERHILVRLVDAKRGG